MKNLFKNLMLVAVAAMAFTACQNDNNEVNEVAKKTVISGVLNIENEDTRSGFTGSYTEGDKTFYQSKWDGGETIKIYIDGCGSVFTTVDAEGRFEVAVDGEISSGTSMYVCSPADAWDSQWTPTIPTEQTPRANSVDPAAHILQSVGATVGSSMITMSPQKACYGKMTVNAPENFEIKKVEVSFNGGTVYTLNATNVENNVFWFAVDSMIDVTTFTVTAYGDGDSVVTKTVTIPEDRELKFNWGRVSTFSVSGLDVPTVPEEPEETYDYTTAYVSHTWNDTDKLITFTAEGKEDLNVNFVDPSFDGNSIAAGTYYYNDGVYEDGITLGDYWGSSVVGVSSLDSVVVSVVDGCYLMQFNGLNLTNGSVIERLTFKGTITGLEIPDPRTTLDVPTNVKATVSGKTITLTWNPVENADGYKVWMFSPDNEAITEIVEDTQYVFEAQKANTTYNFNVYSYASDDNPTYKTSTNWEYVSATTEDTDPKMEVSVESLKFKAAEETKEFTVTIKNFTADINVTHGDNEWLTIVPNGNTFTVTAAANDVEEKRYDTIVITAGEFTKEIPVEQEAYNPNATAEDGTEANPYIFKSPAQGYAWYQLVFGTATDGATLIMELNSNIYLSNLGVEYSLSGKGPWYTGGHTYTAPNGTTYFNDDFAAASTAIVTKNADGVQYDILFKIVAGGVTTYYKATVPSNF